MITRLENVHPHNFLVSQTSFSFALMENICSFKSCCEWWDCVLSTSAGMWQPRARLAAPQSWVSVPSRQRSSVEFSLHLTSVKISALCWSFQLPRSQCSLHSWGVGSSLPAGQLPIHMQAGRIRVICHISGVYAATSFLRLRTGGHFNWSCSERRAGTERFLSGILQNHLEYTWDSFSAIVSPKHRAVVPGVWSARMT